MTIEYIELKIDEFYSAVYEYGYDCCYLKGNASTENIKISRDNLIEAIKQYKEQK